MANRFAKPRRGAQVEVALPAQFYRQLADLSPQILWSARPDGSAEFFNARACQYSGRTAQQLEGWGWRSIVHPEDWQRCMPRWTKAFKRGQPYEVEYRLRRHDGRYFWHLGSAMPHREGGRIVRWFGSTIEIEGQKRAEKLLEKARATLQTLVHSHAEHGPEGGADAWRRSRETEERLRSMIALSSDFFWETDAEHRLALLEAGGHADSFVFTPGRIGKTRWEIPSVLPDAEGWRRHREILDARQPFRDFEIARKDDA
ncbi:MAG TPA: PAS domain S-box protein, partial [Burkholderiales bacterium]|nr:PAS domain S-box protein [Burkholderiales bacterium]